MRARPNRPARLLSMLAGAIASITSVNCNILCDAFGNCTVVPQGGSGTYEVWTRPDTIVAEIGETVRVTVGVRYPFTTTWSVLIDAPTYAPGLVDSQRVVVPSTGSVDVLITPRRNTAGGRAYLQMSAAHVSGPLSSSVASMLTAIPIRIPDVVLQLGTSPTSVMRGDTGVVPISLTRLGGKSDSVFLFATTANGVTAAFAPARLGIPDSVSQLKLAVSPGASLGPSTVLVTAVSGNVRRDSAFTVRVDPLPTATFTLSIPQTPFVVTPFGHVTIPVAVSRNGQVGPVTLRAVALPGGLTASITPNPAPSTTATLTLTAGAQLTGGDFAFGVEGTWQGQTHTTFGTLRLQPLFTMAVVPASFTVNPGQRVTGTIRLARLPGVTDAVGFTLTNVPVGVSATFAPSTTTGDSASLQLDAAVNATPGTATATLTGRSAAGATAQVQVPITVTAAPVVDFALGPGGTVTALGGSPQVVSTTIDIQRGNAFPNPVTFTLTGVPAGVTATISPNPSSGVATVVSFSAQGAIVAGTYSITVTGVGGGLTRSTQITLIVQLS